jgi:hypothetical protein
MIDQPGLFCWFQSRDWRVGVVLAIGGKGLDVARWGMIGRWYERFGSHLTSVTPRLLFHFDETRWGANLRGKNVMGALDRGVFRKRRKKKQHHITLGASFNSFGDGARPSIVVSTLCGAEELLAGQNVLDPRVAGWVVHWPHLGCIRRTLQRLAGWLSSAYRRGTC